MTPSTHTPVVPHRGCIGGVERGALESDRRGLGGDGGGERAKGSCGAVAGSLEGTRVGGSPYIDSYESFAAPSAPEVVRALTDLFRPETVVEVGSTSDVYLRHFLEAGVEAFGTRSRAGSALAKDGRVLQVDPLGPNPFGFSFDLAMCLDVAGKIPPARVEAFVRALTTYADQVVFAASLAGRSKRHVDPRPLEAWLEPFWAERFALDLPLTLALRHRFVEAGVPLPRHLAVLTRCSRACSHVEADLDTVSHLPGSESELDLRLLYHEAARVPADRAVVVLGVRTGRAVAALAFGTAAGDRPGVFAVDLHLGDVTVAPAGQVTFHEARTWETFLANLRTLRLVSRVEPVLADPIEAAVTWRGPRVGLLIMDGTRPEPDIQADWQAWQPHLAPGCLVLFRAEEEAPDLARLLEKLRAHGAFHFVMRVGAWAAVRVPDSHVPAPLPRPRRTRTGPRHRISLIMPTRNEGRRLQATIDDLLANTFYPDFELIVLDDASTDGSTDFLLSRSYQRDPRITLVRKAEQQGYVSLWSEGVARADGSILKFLDAHHCFAPYWLSELYDALARRDFRAIVGAVVGALDTDTWTLSGGPGLFGYTFHRRLDTIRMVTFRECGPGGRVPWLAGHQMMMARATFEAVGGFFPFFEGHGTEDSDLCLRAFLLGVDCYAEPSAVIGHYYRAGHINPVTHADIHMNVLMSTYLNFGETYLETWYQDLEASPAFREGRKRMERRRAELVCFRDWIVKRQSRTPEELLEHLAHY